jgi:hypothetical protein
MKLAEDHASGRIPVEPKVDSPDQIDAAEIERRRDELQHLLSSGLLVPERDDDAATVVRNVRDDSESELREVGLGQNCHEDRRDDVVITRYAPRNSQ